MSNTSSIDMENALLQHGAGWRKAVRLTGQEQEAGWALCSVRQLDVLLDHSNTCISVGLTQMKKEKGLFIDAERGQQVISNI